MNRQPNNLAGRRFGKLKVVELAAKSRSGQTRWICLCDCGGTAVVHAKDLLVGRTTACARERDAGRSARMTKHGRRYSPEWLAWRNMKQRCHQERSTSFPNYGGRGIAVCDEWRDDFPAFLAHVGPRPSPRHSLDRINNDGNYEPGNVRWATRSEQSKNQRPRRERQ